MFDPKTAILPDEATAVAQADLRRQAEACNRALVEMVSKSGLPRHFGAAGPILREGEVPAVLDAGDQPLSLSNRRLHNL